MGIREIKRAILGDPDRATAYLDGHPSGHSTLTIGDREIEIGPRDSESDIRAKLQAVAWVEPVKEKSMTIGEQLKAARAQIAEARQGAANAVAQTGEATQVVKQEIEKVLKEAADLRAEVAELTNGGPL